MRACPGRRSTPSIVDSDLHSMKDCAQTAAALIDVVGQWRVLDRDGLELLRSIKSDQGHFRASHSRIRLHPKVASVLDDLKPHNANIAEYVDNDYRNCAREDHKAARVLDAMMRLKLLASRGKSLIKDMEGTLDSALALLEESDEDDCRNKDAIADAELQSAVFFFPEAAGAVCDMIVKDLRLKVFLCDQANYAYTVDDWDIALLFWEIKGYVDEEKLSGILERLNTMPLLPSGS